MRVPAEISASDVSLLMIFNYAIDGVLQNNQALARLDGYERSVVSSLEKSSAVRVGKALRNSRVCTKSLPK